jgi:hypothetical protein
MQTRTLRSRRVATARDRALRQLAQTGPFLEGNLCAFKRPGCSKPGWHLTFKRKGRTGTIYVPLDLVAEVKRWTRNYRLLKKRIREVTRLSLALVRGHAATRPTAIAPREPRRRSPSRPGK